MMSMGRRIKRRGADQAPLVGCNLEKLSAPSCPHCGPPKFDAFNEVKLMVRATCDDVEETPVGGPHGPRFSHWFCESCERYLTLERIVGSNTLAWVAS